MEYSLGGLTLLPKLPEGWGAMQGGWIGLGYACGPGEGTHERSRPVGTPDGSRSQASACSALGVAHPRPCSQASGGWLQAQARPGCL